MAQFNLGTTAIPAGLSVIEASAGTGKTWTIAHLLPRLLIDGVIEGVDEVVLVTFTEAAARELSERTRRTLAALVSHLDAGTRPEADDPGLRILWDRMWQLADEAQPAAERRLRLALDEADQLMVSTIHSFCNQVLVSESFLCGVPAGFTVLTETRELKSDAVRDTWRADLATDSLLAAVAVNRKWSVAKDLEAWDRLTRRPFVQMVPAPPALPVARQRLLKTLEALKENREDIRRLQSIAHRPTVTWNQAGNESVLRLNRWYTLLAKMDPLNPPAEVVEIASRLARGSDWFNRSSRAGSAASGEAASLPLVIEAGKVGKSIAATGWAWLAHLNREAHRRYEHSLRQQNVITFDGMITKLHGALCDKAVAESTRRALAVRLASKWKVGLIDESQDTDRLQLDLFRAIFCKDNGEGIGRLILVGDPKQAIYSFRGGDLDAYLSVRPPDSTRITTLATTYRSARGLVTALNTLFGRTLAFGSPDLAYTEATAAHPDSDLPLPDDRQGRLVAWVPSASEAASKWQRSQERIKRAAECTASAIVDLLDRPLGTGGDAVEPSHVAVLTRTNREADMVYEALRDRKVPAVVRDDCDVMNSEMAAELITILRAVLTPTHKGRRRGAMATRLLGYNAAALERLTSEDAERWLTRFARWGETWRQRGIAALVAQLETQAEITLRVASGRNGERNLTDVRHLTELLQSREAEGVRAPELLLSWFEGARQAGGRSAEERLRRLEADGDAVQVVTSHGAKGLEFDFVFCPYLWSVKAGDDAGRQILVRRDDEWVLVDGSQLDNQDERRIAAKERLLEDLRLLYVTLTRARRRVTFLAGPLGYGGGKSGLPPTALDWLLRADDRVLDVSDWYEDMTRRKKNCAQCGHAESLRELEARCPGEITVTEAPKPVHEQWQAPSADSAILQLRRSPIHDVMGWSLTSFSRLAHQRNEERERSDAVMEPEAAGGSPAGADGAVPLAAFARGIQAGNCLHELLERWDFRADPEVAWSLRRHRIDDREDAAALQETLDNLRTTRLQDLNAALETAASDVRLSEWEFQLPLGSAGISGQALSALFARHARTDDEHSYAQDLASLPGQALAGMLTGYIDRIVRVGSRWGVVDWKSNYLGSHYTDYQQTALWRCAAGQHYLLQIHLYLVALRRYVQRYDPGGTVVSGSLVFLRGVRASTSDGVLELTPSEAVLDDLDALFARAEDS